MASKRPRERWTTRSLAASFGISGLFHLLVLAVLALAVHPFRIPDDDRPISLDIIPAFPVQLMPRPKPPPPEPKIRLRRLEPVQTPEDLRTQPPLRRLTEDRPLPEITPQPEPPAPLEAVRPNESLAPKQVEADLKGAAKPKRLQSSRNLPNITPLPDEPLPVAKPSPSLLRPVEVPNLRAPSRAPSLRSDRAQPSIAPPEVIATAPPKFEAPAAQAQSTAPPAEEAPAPGSIRALTSDRIIQAPIEIRPPDRAVTARPSVTGLPALPDLAGGGEPPPGGGNAGGGLNGPLAGGGGSQGGRPGNYDVNGIRVGPRMSMRLGCLSPDTYKLTAEERAACLNRVGAEARGARELGINIPDAKQAEYDHFAACQAATRDRQVPGSGQASGGTSVAGLGSNPSLKQCGPASR